MSNLYPPILESQRESIASLPLGGTVFSIPFTMPLSVVTADIGHVQVLIRRQANLDAWSNQRRPVSVPEKEVIYLPGFKASAAAHGANCLRSTGSDLWYVDVPVGLIRGITSVGGGDTGTPGFPAGGPNREGETFTLQIRFGDNPLTFTTTNTFADWKQIQITNSNFGEWSNTQRMFSYALPQTATSVADMFAVTVLNDPVAGIKWDYTPVSIDPLSQVRISYSWSTPDEYGNTFRSKNLDFQSNDGRGASAAGTIDLGVMRFAPLTITLQFTTVNNTIYTWIANSSNLLAGTFPFRIDGAANGSIALYPITGEEIEDGVIAISFNWTWTARTIAGYYRIYRVDAVTLETVLINTVRPPAGTVAGNATSITIKDYSVEMGAEYIYFANAYQQSGDYLSTLVWSASGPLTPTSWNPPEYSGYGRQMNFQGNIFLTTKFQQLRLQGNVTVSSLQRNTSDQFTTTIGGQFPFYSRSAQINYRTMSMQALVSMNFDSTNTFLKFQAQEEQIVVDAKNRIAREYQTGVAALNPNSNDYAQRVRALQEIYYSKLRMIFQGINPAPIPIGEPETLPINWNTGQLWFREDRDNDSLQIRTPDLFSMEEYSLNRKRVQDRYQLGNQTVKSLDDPGETRELRGPTTVYDSRLMKDVTVVNKSQRTDNLIYSERKFRESVMKWLSDGKPKLLRSETEGNMIVMLTGVTFSPFNRSRQLYSLSATVTEVAEYNLSNLILYGLVPVEFESFYIPSIDFDFNPGDQDPNINPTP